MANVKKATLKEILERLAAVEEALKEAKEQMKEFQVPQAVPVALPVNADGKTILTDKTLFVAVPAKVVTTEEHKCQTNTCASTLTKPYDRPSGRLWLCESHKF